MRATSILGILLAAAVAGAEPRAFTYNDGLETAKVFIDPSAIARVQAGRGGRPARVTIEPVTDRRLRGELARGGLPPSLRATHSPVFTPTPNGGRRMALPGGVIVYLDEAMPLEATSTWLQERRLTVVDRLPTDARGFIVASAPGRRSVKKKLLRKSTLGSRACDRVSATRLR